MQASERQWERKAKQWNFIKYTPLQDRLKQQKEGNHHGRNYQRWEKRQRSKSKDRSGRSRSVSPGGLSPTARESLRGRPRGMSTSSGGNSSAEHSRHRGSGGNDLLSPEDYKDNVFDVTISPSEAQRLDSPVLPQKINLEANREQPGSANPIKLHVMQPNQTTAQNLSPPQLHFSVYDDTSAQLFPTAAALEFDNDPMMGNPFEGPSAFPPLSTDDGDNQFFQTEYGGSAGLPDSSIRGQGYAEGGGGGWNPQMPFQSSMPDTDQTQIFSPAGAEEFGALGSPQHTLPQTFDNQMNAFQSANFESSQPELETSFQDHQQDTDEAQRARHDSLVGMYANETDPFQADLVLHLLNYTFTVMSEVESKLRQSNIPQVIVEKIRGDVSLERK